MSLRRTGTRFYIGIVVAIGLFGLNLLGWAGTPPAGASNAQEQEELAHLWESVKNSLKQGAYRDALDSLETILSKTPDDPQAKLYRSLCEQRLKASSGFASLSSDELVALKARLVGEEAERRKATPQRKAIERRTLEEQERWDLELKDTQQQLERDTKRQRQQAQAEAVAKARIDHAKAAETAREEVARRAVDASQAPSTPSAPTEPELPRREERAVLSTTASEARRRETKAETPAEPSQPTAPPPPPTEETPAPAPEEPVEAPPTPTAPAESSSSEEPISSSSEEPVAQPIVTEDRSVELPPVVVSTPSNTVTPSLRARSLPPPGAVQINARQMSVDPDRRIAIADGDVEVIYNGVLLTCDHLTLFTDTKDLYAEGRVRLEDGPQVFRGEMVHYNMDTKKGRFLQGTVASAPWYEHGRSIESLAEGVYMVTPGYLTSCELEPPHFQFYGRKAIVFADDRLARARNVAFVVERVPFLYFPWLSWSEKQMPFFIIPGKNKTWEQFVLTGYRTEWPEGYKTTWHADWRRTMIWGFGFDHQFKDDRWGKGLLKFYFNHRGNMRQPLAALPKGADRNRSRVLWRHLWKPWSDTTVVTDYQKFSDANFRKDLLFRDEYTADDAPESFVSVVKNTLDFSISGLVRKRANRFQTVTQALPEVAVESREARIGDSQFFSHSKLSVVNFEIKRAHSDNDTDGAHLDWFHELKYGFNLLRPVLITPNVGVRETFYNKDIQGGIERPDGRRRLFSGQLSGGLDASLKLFRVFPLTTNAFGLDINWLRHVITPTISHAYDHPPTVPNADLNFVTAAGPSNAMTIGLENKLQTKRALFKGQKPQNVDLVRWTISVPYTYKGAGNKQGGRLGDWTYDLELRPWPWFRLESDWRVTSHFVRGAQDTRFQSWNLDMVLVGGRPYGDQKTAPTVEAPKPTAFEPGLREGVTSLLMPRGQWYVGMGHRYSQNDKTEDVVEVNWRLSEKWEIGTFHRFTWKEVISGEKRFNNLRETQYTLRRDLHDWIAELAYRVDREFGEELFFTMTLKAYPTLPIQIENSYHQPKIGSQSSPFSPLHSQNPG